MSFAPDDDKGGGTVVIAVGIAVAVLIAFGGLTWMGSASPVTSGPAAKSTKAPVMDPDPVSPVRQLDEAGSTTGGGVTVP